MKEISIPFRSSFKLTLKPGEEETIYSSEMIELLKKLRKRGQAVIQSSIDIEEWIKDILSIILFKNNSEDAEFLKGIFLDNDSCMFNTKIKIINTTLSHFKLLKGKERDKITNILPKVLKLRNAFAHGKILPKDNSFYIRYFSGGLIEKELNDEYWEEVETILKDTTELLKKLEEKAQT